MTTKPLQEFTVIDLTRIASGPFCTMTLADFGAKVIKVEGITEIDDTRKFFPRFGEDEKEMSGYFAQYNRNKKGIAVNLKTPEGCDLVRELAKNADVIIENYRPGVMKKFGLDYESLKKINPRIVYAAITGFGQYGPYVKRPAFDSNAQALGGLWSINGFEDRPPVRVGTIIGDLSASLYGTIGILLALLHAKNTGVGQMVDIAQADAVLSLTETLLVDYSLTGKVQSPLGNDNPNVRPYGMFKAKDGYVFFGAYTDKHWPIACEFFGEPEFAKEPGIDTMAGRLPLDVYNTRIKPKLEKWLSEYTVQELEDGLAEKIPLSAIKSVDQIVKDPQIIARNMVVEQVYETGKVSTIGQPVKLSETPADPIGAAPYLGEHTDMVLKEMLGLSDERIKSLKENGVVK